MFRCSDQFPRRSCFISRLGVEAIGQLSVRYERAIEHRSSLIDAKLTNANLENAFLSEWNGYLLLFVDGDLYMADSRQRYQHDTGVMQYEWYYCSQIGVWKNQYQEYRYASVMPNDLEGIVVDYQINENNVIQLPLQLAEEVYNENTGEYDNLCGFSANEAIEGTTNVIVITRYPNAEQGETFDKFNYVIKQGKNSTYNAYLVESKGNQIGGVFSPATTVKVVDNNIFFGTGNGVVCSFNFDKRNEMGEIPTTFYTFDDRTIVSGCATKMDSCGIPHLTKSTIKKSTVIKTKSFRSSLIKVKVRTNRRPYAQVERINSGLFSFDEVDFGDLTFNTIDSGLYMVKEKEKNG